MRCVRWECSDRAVGEPERTFSVCVEGSLEGPVEGSVCVDGSVESVCVCVWRSSSSSALMLPIRVGEGLNL